MTIYDGGFPEGRGEINHVVLAAPAPGTDWAWSPPANMITWIDTVFYQLTTGPTSGNRYPFIQFQKPSGTQVGESNARFQSVNQTKFITYMRTAISAVILDRFHQQIPDIFLEEGDSLRSLVDGLKGLDQISNVHIHYRTWRI